MEASPLSSTAERYWTEEKERALIAFFSKHNCLWNHKSESYKNRQLRWKTLEHLRILLSAHPPPVCFTIEDIKYKFKNLRTTFQRLYKMVKASRRCRSEDVFVPQWKHYQQLTFLQDCWDQEDNPEEQPPSPLIVLQDQEENQPTLTSPGLMVSLLSSPSTTPTSSNMTVKSRWTEDRERALIAFFNEHSCLWNRRAENHNNRQLRQRLLEVLCTQLSDNSVSFSVLDVKCKFKNLRTVFNREYKAVQACRASDKLYVSKWKHYQQLLFLCESCDEDDSTDDLQDLEQGTHTPSSTLSSFSSSSTLNFTINHTSSCAKANTSAAYQIFQEDSSQSVAPTAHSPSSSLPDIKPCTDSLNSLQPDIRGVDSRCYWNEAKVQQLISFYSEHSCLWNYKSPSYRNRQMRESLLDMLSSLLSINQPVPFTVEDIKTKFRNLRTIFQREHKVVSFNRTCGSEDFYLPKWKYYRELMFLCDSCDEEEDEEKLYKEEKELELELECCSAPPSSFPETAVRQQQASPPSPTPPDSVHSSPSCSASTSSRESARKRSSLGPPAFSAELLDWMRALVQSQAAAASPHAGFLKYVEECLNETPPHKVKKLKRRILDTIHSLSEEV